jgi:hypothetical protein
MAGSEAPKIVGPGKRNRQSSSPTALKAQTPIRAEISGNDRASAEGISAHGHAPVLRLCRQLLAAGFDPTRPLFAYRRNVLCLIIRAIGEGAALAVDESRAAFARWKPFSHAAVASRIARRRQAATPVAGAAP